jgi:hypothetical protein
MRTHLAVAILFVLVAAVVSLGGSGTRKTLKSAHMHGKKDRAKMAATAAKSYSSENTDAYQAMDVSQI